MPAVFHDPTYGDDLGHFTHYAALVGDEPGPKSGGAIPTRKRAFTKAAFQKVATPRFETTFSPAGLSMKGATIWPLERFTVDSPLILSTRIQGSGGIGPSGCLIVAAVSPDRKIPWTKPEDITVGPEFPLQLGQPGGIAAPYSTGKAPHLHRAAPVLFDDGKSSAIVDTIDPGILRALLARGGGWEVDRLSQVPVVRFAEYRSPPSTKLLLDCDNHPRRSRGSPSWSSRECTTGAPRIELPYPYELGWTYEVTKVDPGGTARIVRAGPSSAIRWPKDAVPPPDPFPVRVDERQKLLDEAEAMPVEGLHLMLVQPLVNGGEPRLLRVEVTDVRPKESSVRLGKAGAAILRTGDRCSLIRPQNVTAAQLRTLPDVIPVTAEGEKGKSPTARSLARSLSNLCHIGRVLYQNDCVTPAFLVGPDGKPWHSWRVLLLPYLGYRDLFDQYDFSQPWDTAKNLRLLDKMPSVYHDPIHGDKPGRFTHYAALVGGGPGPKLLGRNWPIKSAFSTSGWKMKNVRTSPLPLLSQRDVTKDPDGCLRVAYGVPMVFHQSDDKLIDTFGFAADGFRTILVAAVSPERKIPWTKPEDITVGPDFPLELGQPGGIASPDTIGKGPTIHRAAPVLFADGTSSALLDTIDRVSLYNRLTWWTRISVEARHEEGRVDVSYAWSHPPKLVIDCESGRATITEPSQAIRPDLEIVESDEPGVGRPGGTSGQANQPAPTSAIAIPYPYERGWTYKVTKVDPGGTAQIEEVRPARGPVAVAHRGPLPDAGPAARRRRRAKALPRRGP